jgi:small subunit ribosomal protein S16
MHRKSKTTTTSLSDAVTHTLQGKNSPQHPRFRPDQSEATSTTSRTTNLFPHPAPFVFNFHSQHQSRHPPAPPPLLPLSKPQKMVLRIRLARFGRKRQPLYNIVLTQARSARGSKPMEVLGTFNPLPQVPLSSNSTPPSLDQIDPSTGQKKPPSQPKQFKHIRLDTSRTKYWLGVGAQPSEPVEKLLALVSFSFFSSGGRV